MSKYCFSRNHEKFVRRSTLLAIISILTWFANSKQAFATSKREASEHTVINFYVSPKGTPGNSGTAEQPFATPEEAQTAVRRVLAKGVPAGGITVWLHGGTYFCMRSFTLDTHDSGAPGSPVTYRAMPGETPRLVGGVQLDSVRFRPVTEPTILARLAPEARGHVLTIKLSDQEAHVPSYPDIFHGNGGLFNLIIDDHVQPLSRWPNAGYTTIASVINSGIAPPAGGTFIYKTEAAAHMQRWATAAKQDELWLTGFWRVPFEVETVRVASIDPNSQSITLAAPVPQGIGSKYTPPVNGTRHGNGREQYYATNLVEEIDRPGEWSYDFRAKTLYVWPPKDAELTGHEVLLSNLNAPVILLNGASNVHLVGLTIEGSIHEGVQVLRGKQNLIAGCTLRNIGAGGIDVEGGEENQVQSNDLTHLGSYGIHLVSGDRKSLTPGKAVADNNHISFIGEQDRITEGIFLDGFGNSATHNLIHDAPYNGIRYQGNDEWMAYNEIHHIGMDAGDLGIFYSNGDWAAQGNRIEHNFGHHSPNANGSYIDDGASGRSTIGNIFYKLASGIFIGGGHDNLVQDNLIIDCRIGIHVDNRGIARHYDANAQHLTQFLRTIDPNRAPWSTHYPDFLKDILANPTPPLGNRIDSNTIVASSIPYQINEPAFVDEKLNPTHPQNAVVIDPQILTFRLLLQVDPTKQTVPASAFHEVSVAQTGVYIDRYRTRLPTAGETGRNVDRKGGQAFDSNTDVKASDATGKP